MKRIVVIFLCLQLISSNTFALELAKIPFLIEHYVDSKTTGHTHETFVDFLVEHYVRASDEHEADGECHENLPFKHCHDCCSAHHVTMIFTMPENSTPVLTVPLHHETTVIAEFKACTCYHGFIWQPPKIG